MSLYDRIVPRQALRWGRLTDELPAWLTDMVLFHFEHTPPSEPPEGFTVNRVAIRGEPWLLAAGIDWTSPVRPDPAALWGEADRRAEGDG